MHVYLYIGEVTSVNSEGEVEWRQRTRSSWLYDGAVDILSLPFINAKSILKDLRALNNNNKGSKKGAATATTSDAAASLRLQSFWPSVTPLSLRVDATSDAVGDGDHIIVAGQHSLSLLSSTDGSIRGETTVIDVPTTRVTIGDWSRDGINDIIVTTPLGYYGIIVEERLGAGIAMILLWCTLAAAVIVSVIMRTTIHHASNHSSRSSSGSSGSSMASNYRSSLRSSSRSKPQSWQN
jgi:hypothetical protein